MISFDEFLKQDEADKYNMLQECNAIIQQKGKEIERLNNIRNKAIDFLKKNACIDEDVRYFCDDLRYDDCNILLDILEGVDKE